MAMRMAPDSGVCETPVLPMITAVLAVGVAVEVWPPTIAVVAAAGILGYLLGSLISFGLERRAKRADARRAP